ncbi:hypothetical protein LPJ81_003273 [Coemansia sp. IMI 209127]|nr:hypothetical protein LPJ81_003273 [Coemansia sp. IMI 209127]
MVNFIDPNIWGPAALFNHIDSSLKDSLRGLLHLHPPRSWKDLKRVYLLADPPMLTTTEARDMLGQLKLDVTRPFGEYVFKFERLRRHAGLDRCSNETIDFFMLGLNTYLEAEAEEVYLDMQPGDDIEALYQFIREAEHHLY